LNEVAHAVHQLVDYTVIIGLVFSYLVSNLLSLFDRRIYLLLSSFA